MPGQLPLGSGEKQMSVELYFVATESSKTSLHEDGAMSKTPFRSSSFSDSWT
jgi:hypothetical protein